MNETRRNAFYMSLVEHFYRLAVRRTIDEVQGPTAQKWHQDTERWLLDNCTNEERTLIRDFYTYNQSVRSCTNYKVTSRIYDISERFALDMGLC